MQHQHKTASLGSLPTTSALASCGNPGNENKLYSNVEVNNSLIVESLPKNSFQQQHYKEEGDVLSSQQPTFLASSMASRGNNDKCVNVAMTSESSCSISSDREGVKNEEDDNNSNPHSSESNLTSHSVLNGKANESLDSSNHYSACNLKYNLQSNDEGITKYDKGKN